MEKKCIFIELLKCMRSCEIRLTLERAKQRNGVSFAILGNALLTLYENKSPGGGGFLRWMADKGEGAPK